jgi:hypothetical protein
MLSQELNHEEDQPVVLEQNLVHDFAQPVSGEEGVKASILAGGWTTRAYRDRRLAVMQKDLIVMRFEDPGPTGTKLTGWGEGFPGPGKIAGDIKRRKRAAGIDTGEGDIQDGGDARDSEGTREAQESEAAQVLAGDDNSEDKKNSEHVPNVEDTHNILAGDENITALDFVMFNPSGLVSHYRVTPVDGTGGMHWKGEWSFDDFEGDTGVRPFEMFKAPPAALRNRYILEDVSPVIDGGLLNEGRESRASGVEPPARAGEEVPEPPSELAVLSEDGAECTPKPPPELADSPVSQKGDEAKKRSNIALARWRYAGEAVLYQVRRKLHSTSFYRETARERKRYILITMKLDHEEQTDAEYCEVLNIRKRVDPNVCYVWNRIADFYGNRKVGEHVYVLVCFQVLRWGN